MVARGKKREKEGKKLEKIRVDERKVGQKKKRRKMKNKEEKKKGNDNLRSLITWS